MKINSFVVAGLFSLGAIAASGSVAAETQGTVAPPSSIAPGYPLPPSDPSPDTVPPPFIPTFPPTRPTPVAGDPLATGTPETPPPSAPASPEAPALDRQPVSPPSAGEDDVTPRIGPGALPPPSVAERPESLNGMSEEPPPSGEMPARTPALQRLSYRHGPLDRIGGAVLVGGGFEDFTDSDLRGMTSGGGSWSARALVGTRQFVGLEAAYVGAARGLTAPNGGGAADLVSNGIEGAVRINLPMAGARSLFEPFGFVGLGWQHYAVMNGSLDTTDLADRDDVMTVPMGAGIELAYGMLMMDARLTYRQTYFNDLLRATGGRLDNWGLSAQLGVGF